MAEQTPARLPTQSSAQLTPRALSDLPLPLAAEPSRSLPADLEAKLCAESPSHCLPADMKASVGAASPSQRLSAKPIEDAPAQTPAGPSDSLEEAQIDLPAALPLPHKSQDKAADSLAAESPARPQSALPAELSDQLQEAAPDEPPAESPEEPDESLLADLPDQAALEAPEGLPADLPAGPESKPPVNLLKQPGAQTSAEPHTGGAVTHTNDGAALHRTQRDVAALAELHAYIHSCGGELGEGWTVHYDGRGSGTGKLMYLPPEVSSFRTSWLEVSSCHDIIISCHTAAQTESSDLVMTGSILMLQKPLAA